MTTAPDPRYPQERLEQPMDILDDILGCGLFTLEECEEYRGRMGEALLWEAIETVHILDGTPEDEATPPPRIRPEERRAALRRRKVVVHVLLIVAVITLFSSLYTMALGHDATAWFGLTGCLGLCWMAHRAEDGK